MQVLPSLGQSLLSWYFGQRLEYRCSVYFWSQLYLSTPADSDMRMIPERELSMDELIGKTRPYKPLWIHACLICCWTGCQLGIPELLRTTSIPSPRFSRLRIPLLQFHAITLTLACCIDIIWISVPSHLSRFLSRRRFPACSKSESKSESKI